MYDKTNMLNTFIEYKEIEIGTTGVEQIFFEKGENKKTEDSNTFIFNITKNISEQLNRIKGSTLFATENKIYPCEIITIKENKVEIKLSNYDGKENISKGKIYIDNSHLIRKQIKALEDLKENQLWLGYLFEDKPIIGGKSLPCNFDKEKISLNKKQKMAVNHAVGVEDIYLVWGPPGTGKTSIVPSIVRNYLAHNPNKKILICSYTNKAVDNVITHLFRDFKDEIIRFGPSTLSEKYSPVFFDYQVIKETKKVNRKYRKLIKFEQLQEEKLKRKQKYINKELDSLRKSIIKINKIITQKLEKNIKILEEKLSVISDKVNDLKPKLKKAEEEENKITSKCKIKEKEINNLQLEKKDIQNKINKLESMRKKIISQIFFSENKRKRELLSLRNIFLSTEKKIDIKRVELEQIRKEKARHDKKYVSIKSIFSSYKKLREKIKKIEPYYDGLKKIEVDESFKRIYDNIKKINSYKNLIKSAKGSFNEYMSKKQQLIENENFLKKIKTKISSIKIELKLIILSIKETILSKKKAIITTNLRVCQKELNKINFDLVIMDEAGSIDIPGALIPILKTKKIIFIGDHKQLKPVIPSADYKMQKILKENEFLKKSIFEWFHKDSYSEKNETMLSKQYRMKKEIANFVNDTFYSGKLETSDKVKNIVLTNTNDPLTSKKYPLIYFNRKLMDIKTEYKSRYSTWELNLVEIIINKFKKKYGNKVENNIGIITPFNEQKKLIGKRFPNISCGSVHTFQGQEQSIIIFATTRYNTNNFGPLFTNEYKNLLNVAISRAAEKFIIIADEDLFHFNKDYYGKLYKHIKEYGIEIKEKFEGYNNCPYCNNKKQIEHEACRSCLHTMLYNLIKHKIPARIKTKSGNIVRSEGEKIVDDWLFDHGINCSYEKEIKEFRGLIRNPIIKFYDWSIPSKKVFIELWGSPHKENPRNRKIKEKLYKDAGLKLISIEQEDLENLDKVLKNINNNKTSSQSQ